MLVGLASDVHGDLPSLERAVDSLCGTDEFVFLGDVVGGRNDRECIDLLSGVQAKAVPGNHDLWDFELVGLPSRCTDFLESLPMHYEGDDFLVVHSLYTGSRERVRFHYVYTAADSKPLFQKYEHSVIFIGHTHVSRIFEATASGSISATDVSLNLKKNLNRESRYVINVGQASDCIAIFDTNAWTIEFLYFGNANTSESASSNGSGSGS